MVYALLDLSTGKARSCPSAIYFLTPTNLQGIGGGWMLWGLGVGVKVYGL